MPLETSFRCNINQLALISFTYLLLHFFERIVFYILLHVHNILYICIYNSEIQMCPTKVSFIVGNDTKIKISQLDKYM